MEKNILKRALPLIIFVLLLIIITASSLFSIEKEKRNEIARQAILAKQQAKKAWEVQEKSYLMGKFDPSKRDDFTMVPSQYATVVQYKMYLRKEVLAAFLKMAIAASKDNVNLKIASATRNFDYQKDIWNNKWTGAMLVNGKNLAKSIPDELARFKKILEYSAVPGTSRHHWGTDIDINNSTLEYFDSEKGENEYAWLVTNAPLFGFCQPYTLKGTVRPTGYNEEKWHWSYLPLAKTFTEEYKNLVQEKDLTGFWGDQYIPYFDLINQHVLGINTDCL